MIPNNYNFSLQDVIDELDSGATSLQECFTDSNDGGFDTSYQGSKNSLRNFRGYDHLKGFGTKRQSVGYGGSSSSACNATRFNFFIEYGKSWNTTLKIWSNFEGTVFAPAQWYSDGSKARYWKGSSFTSTVNC